jgi:hypothetical protein
VRDEYGALGRVTREEVAFLDFDFAEEVGVLNDEMDLEVKVGLDAELGSEVVGVSLGLVSGVEVGLRSDGADGLADVSVVSSEFVTLPSSVAELPEPSFLSLLLSLTETVDRPGGVWGNLKYGVRPG